MADKALLNFAAKLNGTPAKICASDVEALRKYGFSEPQILETILLVGLAKFANIVGFGLGTVPDFHNARIEQALGQAPPEKGANEETPSPMSSREYR